MNPPEGKPKGRTPNKHQEHNCASNGPGILCKHQESNDFQCDLGILCKHKAPYDFGKYGQGILVKNQAPKGSSTSTKNTILFWHGSGILNKRHVFHVFSVRSRILHKTWT